MRPRTMLIAIALALASGVAAVSLSAPPPQESKIHCFLGIVLAHDPNLQVYAIRPLQDAPEIRSDSARVPHIPQVLVCSDFSEPMHSPTPGIAPRDGTTAQPS